MLGDDFDLFSNLKKKRKRINFFTQDNGTKNKNEKE